MSAVLQPVLNFRKMLEEDLDIVLSIENNAHTFPWSIVNFRDCLRAGYQLELLECNGVVVGFGILSMGAGEGHILNICVAPQYQCRGFGHYIMQQLVHIAQRHKTENLFLEVRPSNKAAIHLYNKLGFNQVGLRKNYYPDFNKKREDALIFALNL